MKPQHRAKLLELAAHRGAAGAGDVAREPSPERRLTLAVSPAGHLRLLEDPEAPSLDARTAEAIAAPFIESTAAGLFHLGAVEVSTALPPVLGFFRDFARLFVTRLCAVGDLEEQRAQVEVPVPPGLLDRVAGDAPPLAGGEYVDAARLQTWWADLQAFFREEIRRHRGSVQSYLRAKNSVWNRVSPTMRALPRQRPPR
jgi:non-specific serine/threonine protein kinase